MNNGNSSNTNGRLLQVVVALLALAFTAMGGGLIWSLTSLREGQNQNYIRLQATIEGHQGRIRADLNNYQSRLREDLRYIQAAVERMNERKLDKDEFWEFRKRFREAP